MAVTLPTTPSPVSATLRMLDWGGNLTPILGGPVQRLNRLGSRHAVDIELPPMTADDAMAWVQRLKRGKSETVRMAFPQPGFTPGAEGTPSIRAAAAGGTSISIRGVPQGHALVEGQSLSIVVGGKRYVYSCDNDEAAGIANLSFTNHANTTITDLGGAQWRIEKTGGTDGFFDAAAHSTAAFSGDFQIRAKAVQTTAAFAVGANTDPTTDTGFSGIDRALAFQANGTVDYYEGGVLVGSLGSYTTSDYLFIRRVGSVVTFLKGPTIDVTDATLLHTGSPSTAAMYFDSSLSTLNGKVDVYTAEFYHAAVEITPMLRTAVAIGDVVEIAQPQIEGYLEGDEVGWTVNAARHYGLSFSIVEAE